MRKGAAAGSGPLSGTPLDIASLPSANQVTIHTEDEKKVKKKVPRLAKRAARLGKVPLKSAAKSSAADHEGAARPVDPQSRGGKGGDKGGGGGDIQIIYVGEETEGYVESSAPKTNTTGERACLSNQSPDPFESTDKREQETEGAGATSAGEEIQEQQQQVPEVSEVGTRRSTQEEEEEKVETDEARKKNRSNGDDDSCDDEQRGWFRKECQNEEAELQEESKKPDSRKIGEDEKEEVPSLSQKERKRREKGKDKIHQGDDAEVEEIPSSQTSLQTSCFAPSEASQQEKHGFEEYDELSTSPVVCPMCNKSIKHMNTDVRNLFQFTLFFLLVTSSHFDVLLPGEGSTCEWLH